MEILLFFGRRFWRFVQNCVDDFFNVIKKYALPVLVCRLSGLGKLSELFGEYLGIEPWNRGGLFRGFFFLGGSLGRSGRFLGWRRRGGLWRNGGGSNWTEFRLPDRRWIQTQTLIEQQLQVVKDGADLLLEASFEPSHHVVAKFDAFIHLLHFLLKHGLQKIFSFRIWQPGARCPCRNRSRHFIAKNFDRFGFIPCCTKETSFPKQLSSILPVGIIHSWIFRSAEGLLFCQPKDSNKNFPLFFQRAFAGCHQAGNLFPRTPFF